MSKINNVRMPNAASLNYTPGQFDQLIRSIEQIVLQLNTTYGSVVDTTSVTALDMFGQGTGGVVSVAGASKILVPFGAFQDSTTQIDGSTTQAYPLRLNTVDYECGVRVDSYAASFTGSTTTTTLDVSAISSGTIKLGMEITGTGVAAGTRITNFVTGSGGLGTYTINVSQNVTSRALTGDLPSKLVMECPGSYNIAFSIQLQNTSNSTEAFNVWFRQNGVDIAGSNSLFGIPARKGSGSPAETIAAMNFFVDADTQDFFEIMWNVSSSTVSLPAFAAGTSPTRPSTPSAIVTVQFISSQVK
jgi:hypothetical protein